MEDTTHFAEIPCLIEIIHDKVHELGHVIVRARLLAPPFLDVFSPALHESREGVQQRQHNLIWGYGSAGKDEIHGLFPIDSLQSHLSKRAIWKSSEIGECRPHQS